jgi:hypothetical protein
MFNNFTYVYSSEDADSFWFYFLNFILIIAIFMSYISKLGVDIYNSAVCCSEHTLYILQ